MAKDGDDDTVTFSVKGMDRKARWLFNEIVGHDQGFDETMPEAKARVMSELIMRYAKDHLGPGVKDLEERFERIEERKKTALGSENESPERGSDPNDAPGF